MGCGDGGGGGRPRPMVNPRASPSAGPRGWGPRPLRSIARPSSAGGGDGSGPDEAWRCPSSTPPGLLACTPTQLPLLRVDTGGYCCDLMA